MSLQTDFIERLQQAFRQHDLDLLVECATPDYQGVQPAHPSRSYAGKEQLRLNFSRIFGSVPDFQADLLGSVSDTDKVWSEWRWHGTRADGGAFDMRGVMIFHLIEGRTSKCHVYMEPVDAGSGDVNAGVTSWTTGTEGTTSAKG